MLGECVTLVHIVSLQSNLIDKWQWQLDPIGGYLVRSVYKLLTSQESTHVDTATYLIWLNQLPLNVSNCA